MYTSYDVENISLTIFVLDLVGPNFYRDMLHVIPVSEFYFVVLRNLLCFFYQETISLPSNKCHPQISLCVDVETLLKKLE
jgi:hypothetical protein